MSGYGFGDEVHSEGFPTADDIRESDKKLAAKACPIDAELAEAERCGKDHFPNLHPARVAQFIDARERLRQLRDCELILIALAEGRAILGLSRPHPDIYLKAGGKSIGRAGYPLDDDARKALGE